MNGAPDTDQTFVGAIPEIYDQYLVPLIFEPYAVDLAARLARLPLTTVLELAAGTGVVTRRLALGLPATVAITATDLNQPMLDRAAAVGTSRPVSWRLADALELPFADASFDAVVCQFGAMFFPDKPRAFAEARRVLKPGGTFIFNVWDRIEANDFALCATAALACTDGLLRVADCPGRAIAIDAGAIASFRGLRILAGLVACGLARTEPHAERAASVDAAPDWCFRTRCAAARVEADLDATTDGCIWAARGEPFWCGTSPRMS